MIDTDTQNANHIDTLNRKKFVDNLKNVIVTLSNNKKSCMFALDGQWGCGKTFVIQMLEQQIADYQSPETAFDEFLLFHYDCWKYDYYDEPLIAIVAAMLDIVEEQKTLFTSETAEKIKTGWKAATKTVRNVAREVSKNSIGFSFSECASEAKREVEDTKEGKYKFDSLFTFNKTLNTVRNELANLAKDRTILIVVDELDRCLPEYTIKILERLHHIFEGLDNVIVMLSIDKNQIKNTVEQIFGTTATDAYLRKFINFEISLDVGEVSSNFKEKYSDYFALFDKEAEDCQIEIENVISCIFDEVDARTQDKIVKKAELLHEMVFTTKPDYGVMCVELLWLVIKHWNPAHSIESDFPGDLMSPFRDLDDMKQRTAELFYKGFNNRIEAYTDSYNQNTHVFRYSGIDVLELIIVYWSHLYSNKKHIYKLQPDKYDKIKANIQSLIEFANLNEIIK